MENTRIPANVFVSYDHVDQDRVNGFISEDRFRAAVEKVAKTHPLLSVRVHFNEKQEAYFTSIDAPEFPIKFCQRESDRQWFQEIKEQHRIPFNVEEGPLIRFILLNSQQISEFVIFCEHIICDGMSLAYLVKHMLQHLGDPAKEPDPTRLSL